MKKSHFLLVILAFFFLVLVSCKTIGVVFHKTVKLRASWDPNTEPNISHYNLYRVHRGGYHGLINKRPIRHPTTTYAFTLRLPKDFDEPLCFTVTAVDKMRHESDFSEVVCVDK